MVLSFLSRRTSRWERFFYDCEKAMMPPKRYRFRVWLIKWGLLHPWRNRRPLGRVCGCVVEWEPSLAAFVVLLGCSAHWVGELWMWEDI